MIPDSFFLCFPSQMNSNDISRSVISCLQHVMFHGTFRLHVMSNKVSVPIGQTNAACVGFRLKVVQDVPTEDDEPPKGHA